jgi:predicted transcriptional regulator
MKPFRDQMADFDERRKAARVSYRDLFKVTGIQPANLSRYRNGHAEPTISQWVRLNEALDAIIAERIKGLRQIA